MVLATDKRLFIPPPGTPSATLMELREKILEKWMERVKKTVRAAEKIPEPIIIDTLPAFLENLAEALAPNYPRDVATEGTTVATEHGGERARLTRISPADLIKEFQILREVIFEVMGERRLVTAGDAKTVYKSIDQAMTESLTAYFLVHEGLREQFALTLTHDLRSPLTAIKASADLYFRYPTRTEQIPVLMTRISDSANRVDQMIQNLLDASRVSFGEKIMFEVEEFELLSLVEEILDQLSTVHGNRFTLVGESIKGFWNRSAFRRALENLLVNAVKYGDASAPIKVRLEETHGRAIFSVRNEGPHIPAEEQEGIFRSFMRAKSLNKNTKQGWGIGLAMVRGMAEGHGGSIALDSAPGRGTTFILDVPVDSRPYLNNPVTPGT